VERRGRRLEAKSDEDHHQGYDQECRGRLRGQLACDLGKRDRARQAVQETESEKQEGGGDSPEQEVFQTRLGGLRPRLVKTGQHVEREARELEREKRDQELIRGCHQREARGREQDERDVLSGVRQTG
jgi:hypothetical protein